MNLDKMLCVLCAVALCVVIYFSVTCFILPKDKHKGPYPGFVEICGVFIAGTALLLIALFLGAAFLG